MVETVLELSLISIVRDTNLWIRTVQIVYNTHIKHSIRPSTLEGKLLGWWRQFEYSIHQHERMTQLVDIAVPRIDTQTTHEYLRQSHVPLRLLVNSAKFLKTDIKRYANAYKREIRARLTQECDSVDWFRILRLDTRHMGWVLKSTTPHQMKWLAQQEDASIVNELIHCPKIWHAHHTDDTLREIGRVCTRM